MDIDMDLVQRAQVLLTMEHPLSQVQTMLIREGYHPEQVDDLMQATKKALNYFVPSEKCEPNRIEINLEDLESAPETIDDTVDLLVDKITGKVIMLTPQKQETWRVASEVRKAVKSYRAYYH